MLLATRLLTSLLDFSVSPVDVSVCDRSARTRGGTIHRSLSLSLSLSEADMRGSSQVVLLQREGKMKGGPNHPGA